MSKNKSGGFDFEDRSLWAHVFRALSQVLLGSEREQKEGVEMMLETLRTDFVCARRMLRILGTKPKWDAKFPEIRRICEQTVGQKKEPR